MRVAIKMVRNNDVMAKAAETEVSILQRLAQADPKGRRHCVRLLSHFAHRQHVAMVFEHLSHNLREILNKFGRDVGMNVMAVRRYAKQMFVGLHHLASLGVVHADIKPDNILVNDTFTTIKICDLGSAFLVDDADNCPTPYLASRFYRSPEVILALAYDTAVDMWAIGTCLFELFTGRIMFSGATNNDMLWLIMRCKGRFPVRMLRRHRVAYDDLARAPHFTEDNRFRRHDQDRVTGKHVLRVVDVTTPAPGCDVGAMLKASMSKDGEDRAMVMQLRALLEKCLELDPAKRIKPAEALADAFVNSQSRNA